MASVNILDTPGHEDFCKDTTDLDGGGCCGWVVADSPAKGIEAQTKETV